ncbi:hypothetical protein EVAR_65439_1 [Eumeta japonica]|uniref:Uncharacterized protein n=1 Tax=Eumeta variegata TaxID=151549 RepID=A0A4C1ZFF0_EUMVA|nr:hypothetical protein EVAR_65439_1 [Eumeta japonica]
MQQPNEAASRGTFDAAARQRQFSRFTGHRLAEIDRVLKHSGQKRKKNILTRTRAYIYANTTCAGARRTCKVKYMNLFHPAVAKKKTWARARQYGVRLWDAYLPLNPETSEMIDGLDGFPLYSGRLGENFTLVMVVLRAHLNANLNYS